MNINIFQLGKKNPPGLDTAIRFINNNQTIWKLIRKSKIEKPNSLIIKKHLIVIPAPQKEAFFNIGITCGEVSLNRRLSDLDLSNRKSISTEYEWKYIGNYDPPEAFWAFILFNICFQITINRCNDKSCIGYKKLTVDSLLLKIIGLNICKECMKSLERKYKYQYLEIIEIMQGLKNTNNYSVTKSINKKYLPVFQSQVRRNNKSRIFDKYAFVIIMHYLENLVIFIEALMKMGANPKTISIIVKPYPYSHRSAVHSYLGNNYPEIRIDYLRELPPSRELLKEVIEETKKKARMEKLIIIEDGGYIVPFIHDTYSEKENMCIGAVEQTTKGLRKDQKIGKFLFPIMNVAKSEFKDEYEAPLVGRSIVHNIQKILNEENLSGKRALVIGFGAIGRQVARALSSIGMIVKVFDEKKERMAAALARGFETSKSISDLTKGAHIIVGTTGNLDKPGIDRKIINDLEDGAILVSGSSDRSEIDIPYIERVANESIYKERFGTYYKIYREKRKITLLLLADGFPINFFFGSGIPTMCIDPILTQLLIGAIHLAKNHEKMPKGIFNNMDDLLNEYKMTEDFINTYYESGGYQDEKNS